jgi:DNA-binding CsgD family transcriptional regulator
MPGSRLSNIELVAQSVFEAGLGQTSWKSAVADMVRLHNGAGGVLFQLDRTTCEISDWNSVNLNDEEEYIAEMNAINPRMHHSLSHPGPHVITDFDCISPQEMARHEFYRWLETRCHLQFFIGARVMDAGNTSTFMSVEFEAGDAPPHRQYLEDFQIICTHCANAKRLADTGSTETPLTGLDSFLAHKSSTALFFLDNKCRFFFANPAGEELLSGGQSLKVAGGYLTLAHKASQSRLAAQYKTVQDDPAEILIKPFRPIFVPSVIPGSTMLVRLIQLPHPLKGPGNKWSSICLFVQTASIRNDELKVLLMDTFTLTSREADLALGLRENGSIAEAAAALGIAHNTARVHLQRVFKKTSTRTQAELAVILERLAAWT